MSKDNFIVLDLGSMIYDLRMGILYEFHAQMDSGDSDKIYVRRVGHLTDDPFETLLNGPVAREFWSRLSARVKMEST